MNEDNVFIVFSIVFIAVLLLFVLYMKICIVKLERKNNIAKGLVDKLTRENVKLIEELYERKDKN